MGPRPAPIFFVHLQKTAGTSLVGRLRTVLGEDAVYPPKEDGVDAVLDVDRLAAEWRRRGEALRVVTGHFPYCATALLDGRFATVTVLRDPVERTLSYLRHHRKLTPEDGERPLEDIYEDPFRFEAMIHNHMVKMLGMDVSEMASGMLTPLETTRAHLERAMSTVAAVDLVGIQEDLAPFWHGFGDRFEIDLGPMTFANRTAPEPVPEAFRRRIEEDNALDVELYEHARTVVAAGGGREGARR